MYTLQTLFVFYYIGHILTMQMVNLSDTIYTSEWYRYPLKVQQLLRLMIVRSQKRFYISGYGVLACTLENFLGVSQCLDQIEIKLNFEI